MDHNQQPSQGRRGHFHRGRRGSDRRGPDRREPSPQPEQAARGSEHIDVEQIMRDIRARIAQRHGIELSNQQVQELAARRLEAILDPRTISPALLDQLRRSAGTPATDPLTQQPPAPAYTFEEDTLFETHRGLLRMIRALLKPILRLFFNPNPLIHALNMQAKINADAAVREQERDRRQTEWNALHYELLQRMVTETARLSIDMQSLSLKVDALGGKVDFNERRVRGIEGALHQPQSRPHPRPPEVIAAPVVVATQEAGGRSVATAVAPAAAAPVGSGPTEGQRRRRRRRRGRRGTGLADDATAPAVTTGGHAEDNGEADGGPDDEGENDAVETENDAVETTSIDDGAAKAEPFSQPPAVAAASPTPTETAAEPVLPFAASVGHTRTTPEPSVPAEAPDSTRHEE